MPCGEKQQTLGHNQNVFSFHHMSGPGSILYVYSLTSLIHIIRELIGAHVCRASKGQIMRYTSEPKTAYVLNDLFKCLVYF